MPTESNRPWYISSSGSGELSRTVKGFFTAGTVTTIVLVLQFLGVDITTAEANTIVEQVTGIIAEVGIFLGMLYGLYGSIMKIVNKTADKEL